MRDQLAIMTTKKSTENKSKTIVKIVLQKSKMELIIKIHMMIHMNSINRL